MAEPALDATPGGVGPTVPFPTVLMPLTVLLLVLLLVVVLLLVSAPGAPGGSGEVSGASPVWDSLPMPTTRPTTRATAARATPRPRASHLSHAGRFMTAGRR